MSTASSTRRGPRRGTWRSPTSCLRRRASSRSCGTRRTTSNEAGRKAVLHRWEWGRAIETNGRKAEGGAESARPRHNPTVLINISGLPGSGKTTVARLVAEQLGLEHVYAGDLFRRQAAARGLSLEEYARRAETDHSIDRALDEQMQARAARDEAEI